MGEIRSIIEYPDLKIVHVGEFHSNNLGDNKIISIFEFFKKKYNNGLTKIYVEHEYRSTNMRILYGYAIKSKIQVEVFDPRSKIIDKKIKYFTDEDPISIRYIIYKKEYKEYVMCILCIDVLNWLLIEYKSLNYDASYEIKIIELLLTLKNLGQKYVDKINLVKVREIIADFLDILLIKKIEKDTEKKFIFILNGDYHTHKFKNIIKELYNNTSVINIPINF